MYSRALARPRQGTLRVKRAWENLEDSVGGREQLVEVLEFTSDPDGHRLRQHLEDPRARGQSLRKLCADARISFPALYFIFKDALKARAHAEVLIVQSQHLPAIMEDTCLDAMAQTSPCPFCDGAGSRILDGESLSCLQCEGTGKIRKPGSAESRKLVFESAGLTGKRAPLVAVQQKFYTREEIGLPTFEEMVHRGRDAIEGITRDRKSIPAVTGPNQPDVEEGKDSEDA